jgi:hypothetical protein
MTSKDAGTTMAGQREVFTLTFALFIAYVVSSTIYTLYIHPLSKFPGPFWAKVSTIPSWWHTRKKKKHLWLLELQETYGECPIADFNLIFRWRITDDSRYGIPIPT